MSGEEKIKTTQHGIEHIRLQARRLMSDVRFRLDSVATINDIEIINDSKATDLNATAHSLHLMDKPVVWISGCNPLGQDLQLIAKLVKYKVKSIICFGDERFAMSYMQRMQPLVDHISWYDDLDVAVYKAWSQSRKGDIMLFSPGCPGFGQFEDYRQRAESFNRIIEKLNS
jgi:UDP-N-acetylmuramoylalanine--D-glutamate ligase